MKRKLYSLMVIGWLLLAASNVLCHPTGNMIVVGDQVLWSYINPIDDPNHQACVMIWQEGMAPRVFLQSDYPASDYMLYSKKEEIYIIERRHSSITQDFEVRVLKTKVDATPEVIWDWFEDKWRIGEGGFFMLDDQEMVMGRYPEVYRLKKGGTPVQLFAFQDPIKRIRAVENNQILVLSDQSCYLLKQNGTIVQQWDHLIDSQVANAPLNRNQLFDADYAKGELLLAYWGNRSFELIKGKGERQTILQQSEPFASHWVAFFGDKMLLFSSKLVFDGSTPQPTLLLNGGPNNNRLLWGQW